VVPVFWGFGAAFATVLNMPATVKALLPFYLPGSIVFCLVLQILGTAWKFPIPLGLLIQSAAGCGFSLFLYTYASFGAALFRDNMRLLKHVFPLILAGALLIAFMVVFAFYRMLFQRMTPVQQTFFAPVWPLLKLLFKKVGMALMVAGHNPDAAPFALFNFDIVGATSGTFMFLSASSVNSVFSMIAVDVIENLVLAMRIVFLFQKKNISAAKRMALKKDREMATMKKKHEVLTKKHEVLTRRVLILEGRSTDADVDVDDSSSNSSHSINDDENARESAQLGYENLCVHRATRLALQFLASELSEMVCSAWVFIFLPIVYNSPNKKYFYTIESMESEDLQRVLWFSGVDFALEFVTFAAMLVLFQLQIDLDVFSAGATYVKKLQLFLPLVATSIAVLITTFAFFVKHYGMDPEFNFSESSSADNSTAVGP
jgi:hypothetical protein